MIPPDGPLLPPPCPLGGPRCPESICDCFIDQYPDDPLGLHPEAFIVGGVGLAPTLGGRPMNQTVIMQQDFDIFSSR